MRPTEAKLSQPLSPLDCARKALSLMLEHKIEPTPVNYAVWFHYIAGDKTALSKEMEKLLKKRSSTLSNDVAIYLYNRYIIEKPDQEEMANDASSQNAQAILSEIMSVVDKFTGDTQNYNQEIDVQVQALSSKISDPTLKELAKEIVSRALAIRDSGTNLHSKLEDSRREVATLKANLEQVTSDAHRDFLTGTANRKAFENKLEELAAIALGQKSDLCLLMIDIDHFKRINDTYGHLMGDDVLRKVGKLLFESVKGKDVVARYGGEEFAILLPNTALATALIVAENIRRNVAETEFIRIDTKESLGNITISIGVSRFRLDEDSVALFISRADNALYRSKTGGRNRVSQESFE